MTAPAQRWRYVAAERRGGRLVAVLRDRHAAPNAPELVRVYHRLGRWRMFADDRPAPANAAAVARRGLQAERDR